MTAPKTEPLLLSAPQRKLVGLAVVSLAVAVLVALLFCAIAGVGWLLGYFSGVIWPLAAAGILALILRPFVDQMVQRLKISRTAIVLLLYGVVMVALAVGLIFLGPLLLRQAQALAKSFPDLWQRALAWPRDHFPDGAKSVDSLIGEPAVENLGKTISDQAEQLLGHASTSLAKAGAGLWAAITFFMHVLLVPIYLLVMLILPVQRGVVPAPSFLPPPVRASVVFLIHEFLGIVVAFFRGQMLIGAIMGVLYALGFTLVGLNFGIILGLMLGLLNVIPYLGTLSSVVTVIPVALFQTGGGGRLAGLVLVVLILVQGIEGWLLTPPILGRQTGLHPLAITVAIFFWTTALGWLPGLLLAVPLTAFLVSVWRFVQRKFLCDGLGQNASTPALSATAGKH